MKNASLFKKAMLSRKTLKPSPFLFTSFIATVTIQRKIGNEFTAAAVTDDLASLRNWPLFQRKCISSL